MSDLLRAGVIGLGQMGRHHVRVLRSLPDVQLVGVADPLGDEARVAGDVPVLADLAGLLALDLDLCVVATPTDVHEELGLELAAAGVATLIEKPLAADSAAGLRLVEAFGQAGVPAAVGHIERFNAATQAMKERLSEGSLGVVYQVVTSRQGPFPGRVRDVGVVKDLATHDLDLTEWMVGSPYVTVAARVARRTGRPHEDLVVVVGTLADGTITNHLVNWLSPVKERRIVVSGSEGCLSADTLTADLTFNANGQVRAVWDDISRFRGVSEGDMIRYALDKPEPLLVELEQFTKAARGEPGSVVTLSEGLRTLRVAESVLASAASGEVVVVAP
ncbi:MAG TPA: Gfo/Idh/MocA family oxidoreductase [Acidimicrobiales bacterium]|nr:Gfo/Idh/MocA family oxidoreductase [Acidimicrobiales bacterium]